MANDINENHEDHDKLKEVLDKTLHRFKNNLQTQLSLMNIQTATNRLYFDDKKVIVDRMFALTHIYNLLYRSNKASNIASESFAPLDVFMLQFYQYLKTSTAKIEFNFKEISKVNIDVDDLLLLSYIVLEFNDFRQSLDDNLYLEIYQNKRNIILNLSFLSLKNHLKFKSLFENHYKILDLLVAQLKGKFIYEKKI